MDASTPIGYLRLGRARLDLGRGLLLNETGAPVMLRRKSFEVLRVLTELAGRVVPRERLLDTVWGDVHVTDDSLTQCVLDIRRAIGDPNGTILRTVPRRGYLLDVPAPAAPEAAAVAILPFATLGPGEAGRAFADGLPRS
jgi:DNA-binding winged helix-turn-helix (wHTH) protein